jgi:hypothetical protein
MAPSPSCVTSAIEENSLMVAEMKLDAEQLAPVVFVYEGQLEKISMPEFGQLIRQEKAKMGISRARMKHGQAQ